MNELPEILKTYVHEHFNDQGADFEELRVEAEQQINQWAYDLFIELIGEDLPEYEDRDWKGTQVHMPIYSNIEENTRKAELRKAARDRVL